MSDAPDRPAGAGEQPELLARLRAVVEAKDAENAMPRAELDVALQRQRWLELRIAELERRLGQDSTNSGTPPSGPPRVSWRHDLPRIYRHATIGRRCQ